MSDRGKLALPDRDSLAEALGASMRAMISHATRMPARARRQPGPSVHEWRKSLRRARALLRVAKPALADHARQPIGDALRTAQRAASGLRDADILPPLLRSLRRRPGLSADERRALANYRRSLPAPARQNDGAAAAELGAHLGRIRAAADRFERALPAALAWRDLEQGLRKSYADSRKALRRLRARTTDEHFHDLRKSVKVLHYQTELLASTGHRPAAKLRKRLSDLAEAQGQVTDLMLLRARLHDGRPPGPLPPPLRPLDALVAREIADRRKPVIKQARKLLKDPPKKFARRLIPG